MQRLRIHPFDHFPGPMRINMHQFWCSVERPKVTATTVRKLTSLYIGLVTTLSCSCSNDCLNTVEPSVLVSNLAWMSKKRECVPEFWQIEVTQASSAVACMKEPSFVTPTYFHVHWLCIV